MSGHLCGDCQRCPACGRSAWCESDRILNVPCEHHGYCGDCNIENCLDCRLAAECEIFRTGEYDPRADPFVNHRADTTEHEQRLADWQRAFDPVTNSYRRPS